MPHEQTSTTDTSVSHATTSPPAPGGGEQHVDGTSPDRAPEEPLVEHEWHEDPSELPRRPRRRLLTPLPLALLGVLLTVCGFIGGVLVEKGQGSSSSAGASSALGSRFAGLRSAAGNSAGFARGAAGGSGVGTPTGGAGSVGATGVTVGQVAYLSGGTLYVTDSEGNTIRVETSGASSVTKTVKADVKSIHPGETVIVTGSPGARGAISAESIRVSEAGTGGLGGLFGGGGFARGSASGATGEGGAATGARAAQGGGGEPALFGK